MLRKLIGAMYQVMLKLGQSLKRFPESLVMVTAAALLFMDENHLKVVSGFFKEDFPKFQMVLGMGFVLFLCFRFLSEMGIFRQKLAKLFGWLICFGFLVLYYFLLIPDFKIVSIVRYIAVMFCLVMAFFFIPYTRRKNGFELYIIKLVIDFLVTYLYALVLFLGLVAILFTVDQLFALKISSKLYFDILLIVALIFAPAYFLGGVPDKDTELEDSGYPKIIKVLFLYIVMPILSIYTLILYAYFAKVLISQKWPQGMVSNLVLWYSFITAAIIFLIRPLRGRNQWSDKFSFFMPYLIIPLLFMCFWAIGIRIKDYGITENRYYVFIGALWVLFTMIYWIFKKNSWNVILPISLAIVALVSVSGPLSSFAVSFNSQSVRLTRLLEKNNMISDGKVVKAGESISKEDKGEISSILRYIDETHGIKKLGLFPADFNLNNVKEELGFEMEYNGYRNDRKYYNYSIKQMGPVDISGYNFYADASRFKLSNEIKSNGMFVEYNPEMGILKITRDNKKVYEKNILDFTDKLPKESRDNMGLDANELTFVDKQGGIEVKYLFMAINYELDGYGEPKLNYAEFSIFIK